MRCAAVYDDASRDVMLKFKHGGHLEFQYIMIRSMISALHELPHKDILILPVPLANGRLFKRGYNQAGLLAQGIAKHLGAKIDYDSVRRTYREDMGHLGAKERERNISGVFKVKRPDKIKSKNILLVDDVLTTGATFNELTKVLKRAGANWVGGITFCRTLKAI